MLIDRHLRALTLTSTLLFGLSALAFGGAAMLFQTAIAKTAGEAADVAQSMLVTAWNLAIAGGGILGGLLPDSLGVAAFSPTLLVLLTATLIVVLAVRQQGFRAVAC